ncbi:Metal ABC transporter permease [Candidatus Bealeia paramacronuclearis]|uniref:Metal ABC transporter permease n=1 Tax=Candidatus Bealeia paramacronuclearis TaxID=1921001 RepID=A0ABZ2C514_9PROT|nr:Metal ABC transporter permease [Candidatus Bealeia paramacronuclearis]
MADLYDFLISPFVEFLFLRRALVACWALALGCGPVGILLVLRRMTLMGDALSHAILPGAAIGFFFAGLSLPAMSLGGFFVGILVALLGGLMSRMTILNEDASFAGFYLISLALGVLIVSLHGNQVDLMHVLFGSILAVDVLSLYMVTGIASLTIVTIAIIYRPLIIECFDPGFLRSVGGAGGLYHGIFLGLVTMNLVSAFQALGTLMALGMMILPAISARLWARHVWSLFLVSILIAMTGGYVGLLLSYHLNWPSGPAIVMVVGMIYLISLVFGRGGSLKRRKGYT